MKTTKSWVIGIASLFLFTIALAGCAGETDVNKTADSNIQKIKISATIFPLYDIAKNIGGEHVEASLILAAGASPHTYTPSPSDIKKLQGTDVIFSIGHGLDAWTDEITKAVEGVEKVDVSEGVTLYPFAFDHSHDEDGENHEEDKADGLHEEDEAHAQVGDDPHYWLNTANAKIIATNIAGTLSKVDPVNASYYAQNLSSYKKDLDSLHDEIELKLLTLKENELIVFHDSWAYFAREFGLQIAGVVQASPGKEPTPKYLESLYKTAGEHNASALFSEPQLSPSTLQPLIEDLGLKLYVLDPIGGMEERDSYLNLMRYNADVIFNALNE